MPSQDLRENNRAFHPFLASGVPVEIVENGEARTIGLRLFDRGNLKENRWFVVNQFVVQGEREVIRSAVVAFVNGLPPAVLELRSPVAE